MPRSDDFHKGKIFGPRESIGKLPGTYDPHKMVHPGANLNRGSMQGRYPVRRVYPRAINYLSITDYNLVNKLNSGSVYQNTRGPLEYTIAQDAVETSNDNRIYIKFNYNQPLDYPVFLLKYNLPGVVTGVQTSFAAGFSEGIGIPAIHALPVVIDWDPNTLTWANQPLNSYTAEQLFETEIVLGFLQAVGGSISNGNIVATTEDQNGDIVQASITDFFPNYQDEFGEFTNPEPYGVCIFWSESTAIYDDIPHEGREVSIASIDSLEVLLPDWKGQFFGNP